MEKSRSTKEKNQENRTNQVPGSYCTRMADLYSPFASQPFDGKNEGN